VLREEQGLRGIGPEFCLFILELISLSYGNVILCRSCILPDMKAAPVKPSTWATRIGAGWSSVKKKPSAIVASRLK
jgi:hypothetical protein